ncbi:MAG TPA: PAS domain S-box protein, partial [Candidatus Bathyarchaeia archaeon]|nr:PAS domain S-box protein [Candidatus Bathyarchaeia archaeon]
MPVFESDLKWRIVYHNPRAFECFGYTREDLERGMTMLDMLIPEDRLRAERAARGVRAGRPSHGNEYTALRKDGSTFPITAHTSAIVRGGRKVGIRGVVVDKTDRKLAEQELKESAERFKNIVEKGTNLFYIHTPDHVFTYLSPQVEKVLGYKPEEALVRWTDLASDNPVNERAYELTQRAIDTGKRQPRYEAELIAKDGRRVWLEVNEAPLVREGKTVAIIGAAQDITERRRVEHELRQLSAVVRSSDELVNLAARGGKMFFLNEAGQKMLGIPAAEVTRHTIYDVIADECQEAVRSTIVPKLLKGGRWEGELR